ncbi:MAG: DUF433 domain-containing protein [Anaerolineae bacterium]|nr:DUF433 domain-containing protein [Anaerolineae bacterium]
MQLENYFEVLDSQDIRIKGTRIGIEIVIEDFLDGASPEEIAVRYPSLSLEQVYASITYYLANRDQIDAYIQSSWQEIERASQQQEQNPPDFIKRLRQLKQNKAYSVSG